MRSPCCLCVSVSSPIVARQRLSKHLPAAINTHATIKELLEAVFSARFVTYQLLNTLCSETKVDD
jgi:hypothetical protein